MKVLTILTCRLIWELSDLAGRAYGTVQLHLDLRQLQDRGPDGWTDRCWVEFIPVADIGFPAGVVLPHRSSIIIPFGDEDIANSLQHSVLSVPCWQRRDSSFRGSRTSPRRETQHMGWALKGTSPNLGFDHV